jgi:transposase
MEPSCAEPVTSVRLFVATQPVDGRKGADSLVVIVRDALGHDPIGGHLFIFFARRLDRVRIVYWVRDVDQAS